MLDKLKNVLKPKVKVLAGDIQPGDYRLEGMVLVDSSDSMQIDFTQNRILTLEKHTTESAKNWLTALGLGTGMALLINPFFGALTVFLVGNKNQICAGVTLENKNNLLESTSPIHFLATMDTTTFNKLLSIRCGT